MKHPIPRIPIHDLLEYDIRICLTGDNDVEYYVSTDDDGNVSVGYSNTGVSPDWVFSISPAEYIELLKLSIKQHPQYSSIIDFECHSVRNNTAVFGFAVKVEEEYLDDAVARGFAAMGEILQPITEIEQLIKQKKRELQQ